MKKTYIFQTQYHNDVVKLSRRLALIENIKTNVQKCGDQTILDITILSDVEQTFDNICVLIASMILTTYKTQFVTQSLVVPALMSTCKQSLILSLVAFDFESELLYLSNLVSDFDTLIVSSFCIFCLSTLKIKWQEFVFVINSTLNFENIDGFIELTKFLSQNICGTNELDLHIVKGKIMLCDHNQNILEKDIDPNDTIMLLCAIANHNPKIINIHNLSVLGNKNYKILNYVFPNKLNTLI